MITSAGLIYGPMAHHLDHLAPLCALLDIPLIVTEEEIASAAKKYYPGLNVIYWDYLQIPSYLIKQFDTIFSSLPRPLFDDIFFLAQKLLGKEISSIWVPHGNSDKGHASIFMEGLKHDLYALVYGNKMIDFLKAKDAFYQLKACHAVGNFRLTYYLKYKDFYDTLLENTLGFSHPFILYAPTWQDGETSTSFYGAISHLIDKLPSNFHLVIKLHPNLNDTRADQLIYRYENRPRVIFLKEWPPIYSLLNKTSIYIGDMSSIGYDFLTFNRPMFFLNQNKRPLSDPGLFLHKAGISLFPDDYAQIYAIIEKELSQDKENFFSIREEIYSYTFERDSGHSCLEPLDNVAYKHCYKLYSRLSFK